MSPGCARKNALGLLVFDMPTRGAGAGDQVELDVMGTVSTFALRTGA